MKTTLLVAFAALSAGPALAGDVRENVRSAQLFHGDLYRSIHSDNRGRPLVSDPTIKKGYDLLVRRDQSLYGQLSGESALRPNDAGQKAIDKTAKELIHRLGAKQAQHFAAYLVQASQHELQAWPAKERELAKTDGGWFHWGAHDSAAQKALLDNSLRSATTFKSLIDRLAAR